MKELSIDKSLSRLIGGVVLFTIGIFLSIIIFKFMITDFPIWFFGKEVVGVVDEKWYELIDDGTPEEMSFKYFVSYSFRSPDGEIITGSTSLSAPEWSSLIEDGDVEIVYSPINQANNRINDSRFVPLLVCSYIPFLILCVFLLIQGWNILSGELKKAPPHWSVKLEEE